MKNSSKYFGLVPATNVVVREKVEAQYKEVLFKSWSVDYVLRKIVPQNWDKHLKFNMKCIINKGVGNFCM